MVAQIIKLVILFGLSVGITAVGIQAYGEKQDATTGLCVVVMFFVTLGQLFNLIDLAFAG